jgi:hypothetical protein
VEAATGIPAGEICGRGKAPRITHAKETLIFCGHRLGANMAELARLTGLDISTVTRRFEAATTAHAASEQRRGMTERVMERYNIERVATSQV